MTAPSLLTFRRASSVALATLLLVPCVAAQRATIAPSSGSVVQLDYGPYEKPMKESSGETEGDMNCFEIVFARTGLRAIVQNFPETGPEFTTNQRVLAKALLRDVVLRRGNALNDYLRAGSLYGVEFDWFFPGPMGIVRPSLPRTVDVHMTNHEGGGTRFASMFGFLEGDYRAHKAQVEAMIGHPMESFVVWEADLLATGVAPLVVGGTGNLVHGPTSACGDVALMGAGNELRGPLTLAGHLRRAEGNSVEYVRNLSLSPDAPALPSLAALRAEARARGTYFPEDGVLAGTLPPDGIVFAEGSLEVRADGTARRWTLVSATGSVEVRGERLRLTPFLSRTLVLAYEGDVRLLGHGTVLVGEVHAPQGTLDVGGSRNTLLGAFSAVGSSLAGSANVVTDGTRTLHLR